MSTQVANASRIAMVRAAIKALAKRSITEDGINKLSEESRMGGKFADSAIESVDKDAELNAMDRINLKRLMGGM